MFVVEGEVRENKRGIVGGWAFGAQQCCARTRGADPIEVDAGVLSAGGDRVGQVPPLQNGSVSLCLEVR